MSTLEAFNEKYWSRCKERLREKLPPPLFHTFIQPIIVTEQDQENGDIHLQVPDERLADLINTSYRTIIEDTLRETHFRGQVRLRAVGKAKSSPGTIAVDRPFLSYLPEEPARKPALRPQEDSASNGDPFSNFVPHPMNRVLLEAVASLSLPARILFLYGEPGSGKSFLSRSLVSAANREGIAARYITLETFLTEFALSLKDKKTIEWRTELRRNHYLVIDDFQFIKGTAARSQEELRHLVDDFEEKNHHLIICSDTSLEKLPLKDDLASRFHLAHQEEILPPDLSGRREILRKEADRLKIPLEETYAGYLARRINGDVRKLKSALLRLQNDQFLRSASGIPLAPERLEILCQDLFSADRNLRPELILSVVSRFLQVPEEAILGPARDRKYALARHLIAYLCTELTDMRLSDVAIFLKRKDHTAIVHARNKIREMLKKDLFFEQQIQTIIASIRG